MNRRVIVPAPITPRKFYTPLIMVILVNGAVTGVVQTEVENNGGY